MKKKILILALTCFSLLSKAQDLTSEVAKKSLPSGYEKIDGNEVRLHLAQRLHRHKDYDMMAGLDQNHFYRLGDVLIFINAAQSTGKSEPLSALKHGFDAMARNDASYHSELSTINGNKILITNQLSDGLGRYLVVVYDSAETKFFKAQIRYNPADSAMADKIVKHITENLKF